MRLIKEIRYLQNCNAVTKICNSGAYSGRLVQGETTGTDCDKELIISCKAMAHGSSMMQLIGTLPIKPFDSRRHQFIYF